jgi:raffinose/stachyose/melibiose transport system permease protein
MSVLIVFIILLALIILSFKVQVVRSILSYSVMILFVILALFPIVWLIYSSFKPMTEIVHNQFALPHHWIVDNYANAWRIGKLGFYAINSFIYTSVATVCVIVFGLMASFAFAKLPNKLTPLLHGIFIMGILITLQSIVIPLFLFEKNIGLTNTHWGVIIPYIGISLPLAIYLGTEYIKSIPEAIIESAKMDGAGYFRIFFSIILPMSMPVAITIAIMTTLSIWNEFMLVFILSSDDFTRSLPVGIFAFSGTQATEYGMQFAALVIGLVPLLVFYIIFHGKITEGVAAGAVKG